MQKRSHYANIAGIFSSIQGEGLQVGCRHILVRFRGCNLNCRDCDTPSAREIGGGCFAEPAPGHKPVVWDNPLSVDDFTGIIRGLNRPPGLHRAIALTGGEPLLKTPYLRNALPSIRQQNLPVYLETNGTLPDELTRLIDLVDIIAMDIKIASATGEPNLFDVNGRFLSIAVAREVFVKVVFAETISDDEIDGIVGVIGSVGSPVSLVLQPVQRGHGVEPPSPSTVLAVQQRLTERLADVRVIPQVHPLLGVK